MFLHGHAVSARDLAALSALLTPAYVAMNLAQVCKATPAWAATQPRGALGTALHNTEHVKDEIIASFSYDDAVAVLRRAAAAAREDARGWLSF